MKFNKMLLTNSEGLQPHLHRDRHTVQLSLEMRECVDKVAHLIYLLRIVRTRSKSRREGGGEDRGKSDVRGTSGEVLEKSLGLMRVSDMTQIY
jgi:hypothetical protein